jgi:uroporphyrinogen decarboxylase
VETLAATGIPIIMHSDGSLNVIMDDIVQMKISGFNPIQRNAGMDIAALKQKYGNRLCLIGNIAASRSDQDKGQLNDH